MIEHTVGTAEQWERARAALGRREDELAALGREIAEQRRALPWVEVHKQYRFDTDDGEKALAELFDGRSQLLIYHLMYGPSYSRGACPGCTNLADHLDGGVTHLEHRDVTVMCISRAPLADLQAYKRRMGWRFPWVSSHGSDFSFDYGFALTDEQRSEGELARLIAQPPDWLGEWARDVGSDLYDGLSEAPGWNVFARADGAVYHTYSRHAPDGNLLAPYYYQLLDQTPAGRGDEIKVRRRDEYEDAQASAGGA